MARTAPPRRRAFSLTAAIAAVLLVALVLRTANVLLLVFLAVLLAIYLRAVSDGLVTRMRVPGPIALVAAAVLSLGILAGIGIVIAPAVVEQVRELLANLSGYITDLNRNINALIQSVPFLARSMGRIDLPGMVASSLSDVIRFLQGLIVPYLKSGLELVIEGVAVGVMGIYLAAYPTVYTEGVVALIPPARRPLARRILADLGITLRAWIAGQIAAMALLGLLTTLGLWLLGVPYALAFGVFAGVAAIVPFFGTLASTALPALFALTVGGLSKALAVTVLGIVVHLIEANVVAPMVMERQVKLPPVLTIAGVLLMGRLFGTIGLLVAVPVLAVCLVLVRHLLLGEVYGDPVAAAGRAEEAPVEPAMPAVINRG